MNLVQVLFYIFASMAVFSALMVVSSRNTVRSVLFLVLTFVTTAGIWLLLSAEFLSLILVLVYVGAVMTLFLFVVMMLNIDREIKQKSFVKYLPIAALIVIAVVALIAVAIGPAHLGLQSIPLPVAHPADYSNTAALGDVLYTEYAFPFEIAAVLLLTAIVASISLTHRKPEGRKVQKTAEQIAVRAKDRVRLIKMKGEKKQP